MSTEESFENKNKAVSRAQKLIWLIEDLRATDPKKMHFPELAQRVDYLKNTPEGRKEMYEAMAAKEREEARQESLQKESKS